MENVARPGRTDSRKWKPGFLSTHCDVKQYADIGYYEVSYALLYIHNFVVSFRLKIHNLCNFCVVVSPNGVSIGNEMLSCH